MPFLEFENKRLHYKAFDEAEGEWVTLINGYTRSLADFRGFADFLVKAGFRVLTFDNRGAGKTESAEYFDLESMAQDVIDLWDTLKIETSHVLGVSMGGVIATHLTAMVPQRVIKLILVSTPNSHKKLHANQKKISKQSNDFMREMMRYFSPHFLKNNKLLVEGFARQAFRVYQEPATAMGAQAQREAMRKFDLLPLLSKIECPTLVIHGEQDGIISVDCAREISSHISNSSVEIWPDVGHLLLAECPEKLYARSQEFLTR